MGTYTGEAEAVVASFDQSISTVKQTLTAGWYEQADISFLSYKDSLNVSI